MVKTMSGWTAIILSVVMITAGIIFTVSFAKSPWYQGKMEQATKIFTVQTVTVAENN